MLRLYFLQQWFALADEALEDAVYDSQAFRGFLGIDLLRVTGEVRPGSGRRAAMR
jgi:IS5 family transposase